MFFHLFEQIIRKYTDMQHIMLVLQYYPAMNKYGSLFLDIKEERNDVSVAILPRNG